MPADGVGLPESRFVVAETLVRFDHGAGVAEVLAGDPDEIARQLAEPLVEPEPEGGSRGELSRFPTQARYEEMVRTCQEHIRAGDAYQVVPSQRAERPTSASPLRAVQALRRVKPSPYLFLLELGRARARRLVARAARCNRDRPRERMPDRGARRAPDDGDVERLLSSEKDRAEHVMLVDLGRNDLSRVCRAERCTSLDSWTSSGSRTSPISSQR
jgi:anthranilate synthase component 1